MTDSAGSGGTATGSGADGAAGDAPFPDTKSPNLDIVFILYF